MKADLGDVVDLARVSERLQKTKYKILAFTHVDTSTGLQERNSPPRFDLSDKLLPGVLCDAKAIAETARRVSPETLVSLEHHCPTARTTDTGKHGQIVLDGVCSVATEKIYMDEWDIDVVMTASQKGLGTPPGLSILVASQRALSVSFWFNNS